MLLNHSCSWLMGFLLISILAIYLCRQLLWGKAIEKYWLKVRNVNSFFLKRVHKIFTFEKCRSLLKVKTIKKSVRHILKSLTKVTGVGRSKWYLVLLNISTDRQTFDCIIYLKKSFEPSTSAGHFCFLNQQRFGQQIRISDCGRAAAFLSSFFCCVYEMFA